jgi:hypothetical protein
VVNVPIVAFAFGGILLLVGVLGGGFEIKELKVPKVGAGVRVLSTIVGVLFVCLAMADEPDKPGPVVHAGEPGHPAPVEFTLSDQLGDGEICEQVTVLVDGKDLGNLSVSEQYPNARLRVAVPEPGQHSYTAEATAVFNIQGTAQQYDGAGQGMINVQPGKNYSLRGSITGDTWLVSIAED